MAKVIEFYVPKNFQSPSKWAPQLEVGKILEFRSEAMTGTSQPISGTARNKKRSNINL